jgi:tetratricopeptide (TPR) repeat protein
MVSFLLINSNLHISVVRMILTIPEEWIFAGEFSRIVDLLERQGFDKHNAWALLEAYAGLGLTDKMQLVFNQLVQQLIDSEDFALFNYYQGKSARIEGNFESAVQFFSKGLEILQYEENNLQLLLLLKLELARCFSFAHATKALQILCEIEFSPLNGEDSFIVVNGNLISL